MAKKDKYDILAQNITKYLKAKDVYDTIDVGLIKLYVDSEKAYDLLWEDINARGMQINIRKEGEEPYLQLNQSFAGQLSCSKQITAISTKLGITVLDRQKLKLKDAKKPSQLDSL